MSTDGIYREPLPEPPLPDPWPEGKAMGCLPRKSLSGEWCPLFKEAGIPIIDPKDWSKYVGKISLRPWVRQILDQDGVGSCATESSTQAVMVSRALAGMEHMLLNPWFVYHTTSGGRDGGSSIDENLSFIRQYGIAPEALYPRSGGWRATPSAEAKTAALKYRIEEFYDITDHVEMVSALLCGFPVVWGANGHSVLKVEHLNDSEGLDANSWGSDWGDGGFGVWTSYNRINWGYGAWCVRTTKEQVAAARAALGI